MARKKTRVPAIIGFVAMMFCILVISAAIAEEKKNTQSKPASENEAAGVSGMKAGKDPDGAHRAPTKAEENKLNAELKKTLAKYAKHNPKQQKDGSLSLVVAPHRLNATIAHVGPDGKTHFSCSHVAGHTKTNHQTNEELPEE